MTDQSLVSDVADLYRDEFVAALKTRMEAKGFVFAEAAKKRECMAIAFARPAGGQLVVGATDFEIARSGRPDPKYASLAALADFKSAVALRVDDDDLAAFEPGVAAE